MLGEKCAVFGVYGQGFEAARLTYFGLYALQHRGQEGSGITTSDGKKLYTHKRPGLVAQVYTEEAISKLHGHIAIGHNRYSTSQGGEDEHLQPVIGRDKILALAHNGNLPSTTDLVDFLTKKGLPTRHHSDSELMAEAIKYYFIQDEDIEGAVAKAFPLFTGAFSLVIMTATKLVAVRDRCGIRPLSIGKLNGGYVVASETCALDTVLATFVRDVAPGEMVVIDDNGLHSHTLAEPDQKLDIFEFVYFSRPDSYLMGKSVDKVRHNMGIELAKEANISADVVVPVPDSAISAALGYAHHSGIPYYQALIKNRYIGRTFIQPEQHLRDFAVQMKLNPVRSALEGKRVILVDDSIVRGTTSPKVISMLREAGATEVHCVVSSPPYRYPDFYGIDTPDQKNLLAIRYDMPGIQKFLGADSLHYLSYDGLITATELEETQLCTSCFTGIYPIDIRERAQEVSLPT
jgi:amidophosphoribosyltransferase